MRLSVSRPKFGKKHIAFFAVVPLLWATGLVQVNCPISDGTGYLSSAPGMDNVSVVNVESRARFTTRNNYCDLYIMYLYDVTLSVVNGGDDDADGYIKVNMVHLAEGKVLDSQYMRVQVPAGESLDIQFDVWFIADDDRLVKTSEVTAEAVNDRVTCPIDKGTGKVSLNTYFFLNGLEDALAELGREAVYYAPPLTLDPDDEEWVQ